jgi:hypothetical protein
MKKENKSNNRLLIIIEKHMKEIEILFHQKKILETVYLNRDDYNRDLQRLGDLHLEVVLLKQELEGVPA